MKTLKTTLMQLVFAGILVSCDLDRYPINTISPDGFFRTEHDLSLYAMSFYNTLPTGQELFKIDGELSDYFATSSAPNLFINGNYTALDATGWTWTDLYNVNYFLERSHNPDIPESIRNHYIGIARFFRAWFYYDKVKKFGDVPWYDKTMNVDDPDLYKARDPRAIVMEKILEDLNFACTHIYETKSADASTINRWVALAFKSRVCLFEGTFRKYHTQLNLQQTAAYWLLQARQAAEEVMNEGGFAINEAGATPYRDLFTSEKTIVSEVLLADVYSETRARYHDANWVWSTPSTWVRPGLTRRFINTFLNIDGTRFTDQTDYQHVVFTEEIKHRDKRLAQLIRTPSYRLHNKAVAPDLGHTKTGYHFIKFTQDDNTQMAQARNTNTIPLIRYAEVLLNYAEATAETGTFTAQDWERTITLLRRRAGLTNTAMPGVADPYMQQAYFPDISDAVLLEIRRERAIELVSEGFRFDDIRRWKAGALMEKSWDGIYVGALGVEYDLNEDGSPDVCFVKTLPDVLSPGVFYYVLSAAFALSEDSSGNIQVYPNVNKQFEDKKYLYPIPEEVRLRNPNLAQNEGWAL
jgi:hypothetical protein